MAVTDILTPDLTYAGNLLIGVQSNAGWETMKDYVLTDTSEGIVYSVSGRGRGRITVSIHQAGLATKHYTRLLSPDISKQVEVEMHFKVGGPGTLGETSFSETETSIIAGYLVDDTAGPVTINVDISGNLDTGRVQAQFLSSGNGVAVMQIAAPGKGLVSLSQRCE